MNNNRIGENIRYFRKQRGMTQKELGDKASMADSAIRRYEKGLIIPKDENLSKIAEALGVSTLQLRMRGIEKTKEWKYALALDQYLESIGIDVYYENTEPDSEEEPLVYVQGHNLSLDMTYKDYQAFKENMRVYARHLLYRIQKRGE